MPTHPAMPNAALPFSPFRCALLLVLSLCGSAEPFAAAATHVPTSYTLREWHEQDGLPSEELAAVLQDSEGFLWVAARHGLARFDGATFEPVESPSGGFTGGLTFRPGGGAGAPIVAVLPGIRKSTTNEAGYHFFRDGVFRFEPESELAGREPRLVFFGADGSRWIGCEDGTVLRRKGDQTRLFEAPADLAGRKRPSFATDASGQLWILRGDRLSRMEGDQWTEVPFFPPGPELRIASSARGGIWVFTRTALWRWNGSLLEEVVSLPELSGAHFVQAALEDRHGYLWVGTRSQGLFRIVGRDILPVPVSSNDVTALCEDTDGNLWAATDGGGLSRLRPKAHELFDQASGLRDNISYTVAEDRSGAMWLANRDGGMARIVGRDVDLISQRANWRPFSARSVYPAPDDTVWFTTGVGVFRIRTGSPETLERVSSLTYLRGARATFVASNGDYWLAADSDRVVRWRAGQITTFGPEEGYDGRELRAFAEDASGRMWLGAADGALFRSAGDRFERVPFPRADDCGVLQVIRFEAEGTMLIGTTRRGVVVVRAGDFAQPLFLDRERGLADNNVSQILMDDHDRIWFAARRGIFWVHGGQLRDVIAGRAVDVHAVTLGSDDGVPHLSCQGVFQPAAWKASDGTLWFATRRGMLRTDPALMATSGGEPPVARIIGIACDGQDQPLVSEIGIESTVRKVELRLSAVNLSTPESVQIRTRLDGFDDDWVVQAKERVVRYPRLPPGRYVFRTMASNGSGAWSSQPALLTIIVSPPWWQSRWALAVYVLGSIALVGGVVRRWSHRRLRLQLERAEREHAIERERSRIARNIHDDVGASLTRISLLTQAAQQESGVPSATLEKIHETARAVTRSMDEIVWAVNPRHDNSESLVYYISNYAKSFLEAAGIRCRLESPGTLPAAVLTSQVRHHVFLCCKEALHNVVKHARATVVTIAVRSERDSLLIAISDNGWGFSTDLTNSDEQRPSSSGDGLHNMRQRMAEIHGTCVLAANAEGGTTLTLIVPCITLPPSEHPEAPEQIGRAPAALR